MAGDDTRAWKAQGWFIWETTMQWTATVPDHIYEQLNQHLQPHFSGLFITLENLNSSFQGFFI